MNTEESISLNCDIIRYSLNGKHSIRLPRVVGASLLSWETSMAIGTMITMAINVTPTPIKMARFFLVSADGAINSFIFPIDLVNETAASSEIRSDTDFLPSW